MKNKDDETVFGVGFYRKEQWSLLLETAEDRAGLEDTHDEWVINLKKSINNFRTRGIKPLKVDVDMDELLAWCRANGHKNNGESRAEFFAELLRQGRGRKIEAQDLE